MDAEANNNNGDQIDVGILNADESNEQQQQPSGESSATAGGENVAGAAEDNDDSNSYGGEEEPSSLYDVCEYLFVPRILECINISIITCWISHTISLPLPSLNNFVLFMHNMILYLQMALSVMQIILVVAVQQIKQMDQHSRQHYRLH